MALGLLVNLLTVGAMAAGTEITVTPPQALPAVGETFTVSVELAGNPGFAALQFTLRFDADVVDCRRVSTGEVLSEMMKDGNPDAETGAIVAAVSASESRKNGNLATFTFAVVGSGDPKFSISNLVLSDEDGEQVACTVRNTVTGEVTRPTEPSKPDPKPVEPTAPAEGQTVTPQAVFTDVPATYWAANYIGAAVEQGLFGGYADGSFRPGNPVTRGAFVTVLWRMAGKPGSSGETPFTDLGGVSAEFGSAIAWAYEKGYISGRSATTFAPGDKVSRQAAMKILYGFSGDTREADPLYLTAFRMRYPDAASLPAWAEGPMYWGVSKGIISGTSDGRLNGGGAATRAQLAKILSIYQESYHG